MSKIKVLVVDDSAFMRKLIADFLGEDKQLEVIATARNGKDALVKIETLQPDVVTLDIEMPVMNGLEALKEIMERFPRPVIMLSSTTQEGAENTILSLQYGAVDFITKPSGAISLDLHVIKQEIMQKVISAKSANIKTFQKEDSQKKIAPLQPEYSKIDTYQDKRTSKTEIENNKKYLICIGTSTGGPRALQQVLPKLPRNIDAPIFVVQHMPPGFTQSLAVRLNTVSEIVVKEAEDGEMVRKGVAYIAPGGSHLKVIKLGTKLVVKVDQSPIRNGHRPSVDVLFESISELIDYQKVAVIMTGMGSDGTEGLKKLKSTANVKAISESADTSVVFGMPKSAIATKLVDKVVDVQNIAMSVLNYIQK